MSVDQEFLESLNAENKFDYSCQRQFECAVEKEAVLFLSPANMNHLFFWKAGIQYTQYKYFKIQYWSIVESKVLWIYRL